ncbi:hypothetical protein MKX01_000376 [Papaver californicum]|nr:hypothetical protein MKX01_000376 [Papaver californicum]
MSDFLEFLDEVLELVFHFLTSNKDMNVVYLVSTRLKRMVVSDQSLELLSHSFPKFKSLVLVSCEGFTTDGLVAVAANCRVLTELDLQENNVKERSGHWLSCFPGTCTSLISLNFACLRGPVNFRDLESLVARCPKLRKLKLNRSVPLHILQRILTLAPHLTYEKFAEAVLKCKYLRSLSGFLEVNPACLPAMNSILSNLTSLNLKHAHRIYEWHFKPIIIHCKKLQRLSDSFHMHILDCIGDEGLEFVASVCQELQELRMFTHPYGALKDLIETGLLALSSSCRMLNSIQYICHQMTNTTLIDMAKNFLNFIRFRLCIMDPKKPDHVMLQPLIDILMCLI